MKLSITLIAAFPAELQSDVDIAEFAGPVAKRECLPESGFWPKLCDEPGGRRCVCNQGKSVSVLHLPSNDS